MIWIPAVLGVVLLLAVIGGVLLIRALPRREPLSPSERRELASAPMPRLQRRAWWGLTIGVATLTVLTVVLVHQGAAAYWENDTLRLLVLTIFLAGLGTYVAVVLIALVREEREGNVDERDQVILRRAPTVQSAIVLVTLAAWCTALPKMYHTEGAVPVVYFYLMFGCVLLVHMIGQSVGILLGYWMSRLGHGEG